MNWTFVWQGLTLKVNTIRYRCAKNNIPVPSFVCPCCGYFLSAHTIRVHQGKLEREEDENEDVDADVSASEQEQDHKQDDNEDVDADVSACNPEHDVDADVSESSDSEDVPAAEAEDSLEDSSDDSDADSEAPHSLSAVMHEFAIKMRRDLAHNGSLTNTTRYLKTLHSTILTLVSPEIRNAVPKDARTLHTIAGKENDPEYFFRDFCPEDHHMFSATDKKDIKCPKCAIKKPDECSTRYFRNGQPRRRAVYFELTSYVQRILSLPGMLEAQLNWESRRSDRGTYADAVDGSILRGAGTANRLFADVAEEDRRYCLCMAMCTDGCVVANNLTARSMSPVVCVTLTLPEYIRKRFSAMYLAGVLPEGAKDGVFLQPIADMFAKVAPGTAGIVVQGAPKPFHVYKAWRVDDLGGITAGINAKLHGSINGSCLQCMQQGVHNSWLGTRYYMGAYTYLALDDELRLLAADSYKKEDTTAERLKTATKPRAMTEAAARASMNRQVRGGLTVEQKLLEPFHGENVWTETLHYFNIILQSINDPFHELANTIRDIFNLLQGDYSKCPRAMKFYPSRKAYEVSIKRFGMQQKQPFTVSRKVRKMVDAFVRDNRLRLPVAWPRLRYVFRHIGRLSHSEVIGLGGPLGLYILQFCDVDDDIRNMFAELLKCIEMLQAKQCTTRDLRVLQGRIIRVLAECEARLPLYWNTTVRHVLLHMVSFIERCGPYDSHSMACFERFHTLFKKLVRAKRGEMQSIVNHYLMVLRGDQADYEAQLAGKETTPYPSTLAGANKVDYSNVTFKINKKTHPDELSPRLFGQLQDQWAIRSQVYRQLRQRFRDEQRLLHKKPRLLTDVMQLGPDFDPRRAPSLTDEEKQWLSMTPAIKTFTKVVVNGRYHFRTMESEEFNLTDNSVVKEWSYDEHNDEVRTYGRIEQMFIHEAYPGGEVVHFVKARWLTLLDEVGPTGLPQVKEDPEHNFNKNSCMTPLRSLAPYNIALLPTDLEDTDCATFSVIDPEGRLGHGYVAPDQDGGDSQESP